MNLMNLEQIEATILDLRAEELTALMAWLHDQWLRRAWDKQIAEDLDSGTARLAVLLSDVDNEFDAGACAALMKHLTLPCFWQCYRQLPSAVQDLANKNYALLEADPHYPSLQFKNIGETKQLWVGAGR